MMPNAFNLRIWKAGRSEVSLVYIVSPCLDYLLQCRLVGQTQENIVPQ